jgi:hypothetical protein
LFPHFRRRRGIVHAPHDHGHLADLTVTNPAQIVVKVTRGNDGRLTKVAVATHRRSTQRWSARVPTSPRKAPGK